MNRREHVTLFCFFTGEKVNGVNLAMYANAECVNCTKSLSMSDAMCISVQDIGVIETPITTHLTHTSWQMTNFPPWWKNKMAAVSRNKMYTNL